MLGHAIRLGRQGYCPQAPQDQQEQAAGEGRRRSGERDEAQVVQRLRLGGAAEEAARGPHRAPGLSSAKTSSQRKQDERRLFR